MADPLRTRWLFADQLGPHFLDGCGSGEDASAEPPEQQVLLIESRAVFARRRFHRAKAHLVLSALRHRAGELGARATYLQVGTYRDALGRVPGVALEVVHPTSHAALRFVRSLDGVDVLPARGFVTSMDDFASWMSRGQKRQRMEDFYRRARTEHDVLMEGTKPVGGR